MANSEIISVMKDEVIKDIINDDLIVKVIDSPNIHEAEDLINTHIFRYNKHPLVVKESITFLTVQVHLPEIYDYNRIRVKPQLEIWIYSHTDHMDITNIPKITTNRNDYLSQLIDRKFNGSKKFGYGSLLLYMNVEGTFSENFLYRRMLFETTDFNNQICKSPLSP